MNNTLFEKIIGTPTIRSGGGETIGYSRKGNPLLAYRFGNGPVPVSLVGGLHADEPVGPRFLRHFSAFLHSLAPKDPLLSQYQWWIIPHANPDGEAANREWVDQGNGYFQISEYLISAVREKPGEDMEFGFPLDEMDKKARPENKAIARWWETCENPFRLHISFHGMFFGKGPWYLVDPAWISRCKPLIDSCTAVTEALGYSLYQDEYKGEKGFVQISRGFSTRPDSRSMKEYFMDRGETETAARFRPSSMETMRKLSGDCLTLVTEMPLFLVPETNLPESPQSGSIQKWKDQFDMWRQDGNKLRIEQEANRLGITPMPVRDQMFLNYEFMRAGLMLIEDMPTDHI